MKRFYIVFRLFIIMCTFTSSLLFDNKLRDEIVFFNIFDLKDYEDSFTFTLIFDNHGFHNDGAALYEVSIEDNSQNIFDGWDSLPFDTRVEHFVYGGNFEEVPEIKNGKYMFVDRQPETSKYSTNASLFVYDEDDEIGYYLILDT